MLRMHAIFKLRPIKMAKYAVNIFFTLYLFIESSSFSVLLRPSGNALIIPISGGIQIIKRHRMHQQKLYYSLYLFIIIISQIYNY